MATTGALDYKMTALFGQFKAKNIMKTWSEEVVMTSLMVSVL
jgi:hypothetical protein